MVPIRPTGISATNILANRMLAEVVEFITFSAECADEVRLEPACVLGSLFAPPGAAQENCFMSLPMSAILTMGALVWVLLASERLQDSSVRFATESLTSGGSTYSGNVL